MEKEKAFAKYRIYKLAEDERIESFDCGDADLNDFALNDAQPYRKEKLAVTYTLLDKEDIHCVAAFFCLLNDRISMADFDTKSIIVLGKDLSMPSASRVIQLQRLAVLLWISR